MVKINKKKLRGGRKPEGLEIKQTKIEENKQRTEKISKEDGENNEGGSTR